MTPETPNMTPSDTPATAESVTPRDAALSQKPHSDATRGGVTPRDGSFTMGARENALRGIMGKQASRTVTATRPDTPDPAADLADARRALADARQRPLGFGPYHAEVMAALELQVHRLTMLANLRRQARGWPAFTLHLVFAGPAGWAYRRLALALKHMLRGLGFRCLRAEQVGPATLRANQERMHAAGERQERTL